MLAMGFQTHTFAKRTGLRARDELAFARRERTSERASAKRRVRANARTEDDGYWVPGPFLRPEGSPGAESYTGPTVWRLMQRELAEAEVAQIAPATAKAMSDDDGWTLVDVRPSGDYCERHCWGAVNAQYYRAMDAKNPLNWGKAAISALVFPERIGSKYLNVTENEEFLEELQTHVEWGAKLILYDDIGGVIGEPGVNFENGIQTPSLMALYELAARGWGTENLVHMAGGIGYWDEIEGFDCGECETEDVEEGEGEGEED